MNRRWICTALAGVIVSNAPQLVLAQEPAADEGAELEEIVVTARKRAESVQDIPLVVNALTGEQMERASIQGLTDVALRTPGLNYEGYASAGQAGAAVIRGLAPTQLTNRIPNVAVFYDGVYLQNQALQDIGVFDIERVEVLKGPQSALYGRNAFAGAINYISRKPSEDWRAEVGATAGSDERLDYNAFVSGPLLADRAFFKLSYGQSESDGTWKNNHPLSGQGASPGNEGNVGGWDTETWTAGLTLRPVENVEVNLGYFSSDIDREPNGNYTIQGFLSQLNGIQPINDLNCLPRTVGALTGNQAWCGELPLAPPAGNPLDTRHRASSSTRASSACRPRARSPPPRSTGTSTSACSCSTSTAATTTAAWVAARTTATPWSATSPRPSRRAPAASRTATPSTRAPTARCVRTPTSCACNPPASRRSPGSRASTIPTSPRRRPLSPAACSRCSSARSTT